MWKLNICCIIISNMKILTKFLPALEKSNKILILGIKPSLGFHQIRLPAACEEANSSFSLYFQINYVSASVAC